MIGVLFPTIDATSSLASIGAWSVPMFNELSPLAWLILGIVIPVLVVILLIVVVIEAFHHRKG